MIHEKPHQWASVTVLIDFKYSYPLVSIPGPRNRQSFKLFYLRGFCLNPSKKSHALSLNPPEKSSDIDLASTEARSQGYYCFFLFLIDHCPHNRQKYRGRLLAHDSHASLRLRRETINNNTSISHTEEHLRQWEPAMGPTFYAL